MSPRRKMGMTRREWLALWVTSIGAQMQVAADETPGQRAALAYGKGEGAGEGP